MAATRTSLVAHDSNRSDTESLTTLLSRLGEDGVRLINSQFALLKVELKEEANAYISGVIAIAAAGVIAAIGFALLNVAVAFGVSTLFAGSNLSQPAMYALGFIITGVFYLVVGGIVVMAMKSRLSKQRLVPTRTVEELRKDKEWLKKEL